MKKWLLIPLLIILIIFSGCVSEKEKEEPEPEEVKEEEPVVEVVGEPRMPDIIDHKFRGLGDVPEWVLMEPYQIERMSEWEGFYIFKADRNGKDINGLQTWVQNFVVDDEISRLINIRIQTKFAGAEVGDVDEAAGYFEKVVKSLTDARVGGVKRQGDYWVLKRYYKADETVDKEEYTYYVLITVPKSEIQAAIARAFDENPPESEEEKTAKDRVREIFNEEFVE